MLERLGNYQSVGRLNQFKAKQILTVAIFLSLVTAGELQRAIIQNY